MLDFMEKLGVYFFTPGRSKAVTTSIEMLVAKAIPVTPRNFDNVMLKTTLTPTDIAPFIIGVFVS